ncbi:hypothetical protein [Labrys sp. KNU-23]|nr:hypothetical protein [Labrys sp. KNU-23]
MRPLRGLANTPHPPAGSLSRKGSGDGLARPAAFSVSSPFSIG